MLRKLIKTYNIQIQDLIQVEKASNYVSRLAYIGQWTCMLVHRLKITSQ